MKHNSQNEIDDKPNMIGEKEKSIELENYQYCSNSSPYEYINIPFITGPNSDHNASEHDEKTEVKINNILSQNYETAKPSTNKVDIKTIKIPSKNYIYSDISPSILTVNSSYNPGPSSVIQPTEHGNEEERKLLNSINNKFLYKEFRGMPLEVLKGWRDGIDRERIKQRRE